MNYAELIQLLLGAIVFLFAAFVGVTKILDARTMKQVRDEVVRAKDAFAREKAANARAEKYEEQRDQAMANMNEMFRLLAKLAEHQKEADKRCTEGLAALNTKMDKLSAASEKAVTP